MLIKLGKELVDDFSETKLNHSLSTYWVDLKKIIIQIDKPDDWARENFVQIEHVLSEYEKIDPNSQAFRYSHDKNGKRYLVDLDHINIRHLSDCMEPVIEFLDCIHVHFSTLYEGKCEMAAGI